MQRLRQQIEGWCCWARCCGRCCGRWRSGRNKKAARWEFLQKCRDLRLWRCGCTLAGEQQGQLRENEDRCDDTCFFRVGSCTFLKNGRLLKMVLINNWKFCIDYCPCHLKYFYNMLYIYLIIMTIMTTMAITIILFILITFFNEQCQY